MATRPTAAATAACTVSDLDWRHPLCEAFIEGAVQLGIPRNPDYNGAIQEGVAYAQRTINNGRRVSAATAFLHPARKRPNLTVRTHAHSTELDVRGQALRRRAPIPSAGAAATRGSVRAAREVILSAGAYNSPQLLQLSGIGPAERCCNRSASRCGMRSPASARTCATTTRRASPCASRTSTPSTSAPAASSSPARSSAT